MCVTLYLPPHIFSALGDHVIRYFLSHFVSFCRLVGEYSTQKKCGETLKSPNNDILSGIFEMNVCPNRVHMYVHVLWLYCLLENPVLSHTCPHTWPDHHVSAYFITGFIWCLNFWKVLEFHFRFSRSSARKLIFKGQGHWKVLKFYESWKRLFFYL